MMENVNMFLCFLKLIQNDKGLIRITSSEHNLCEAYT